MGSSVAVGRKGSSAAEIPLVAEAEEVARKEKWVAEVEVARKGTPPRRVWGPLPVRQNPH